MESSYKRSQLCKLGEKENKRNEPDHRPYGNRIAVVERNVMRDTVESVLLATASARLSVNGPLHPSAFVPFGLSCVAVSVPWSLWASR